MMRCLNIFLITLIVCISSVKAKATDLSNLDQTLKQWEEENPLPNKGDVNTHYNEKEGIYMQGAKIKILNLQLATITELKLSLNNKIVFNDEIEILLNSCWQHNQVKPNQVNIAEVTIDLLKDEQKEKLILLSHNKGMSLNNESKFIFQLMDCIE